MDNLENVEFAPWILDKFVRHGWWGGKHTSYDNISKGAPAHLRGEIKKTADYLIKTGFLIKKPTSYGLEISLNFGKKNEIFDIIENWKLKR